MHKSMARIAVIGGGAAGMMASIAAAQSGASPAARDIAAAPPVAEEARLCRGSGGIGGHEVFGKSIAATVYDRLSRMLGGKVLQIRDGKLV